jgi:predicted esterase
MARDDARPDAQDAPGEAALERAGLIYGVVAPIAGGGTGEAGGSPAAGGAGTRRPAAPAVVLRGVETDVERLTALSGTIAPQRALVVPQPLRHLYLSRAHVGQRWFVTSIDGDNEPATFGDALYAVEQLTTGVRERWGAPPLLVGHGQGGELALALAAIVPELLAGVVALDAALPVVPGWERPACDAGGLPVLVLPGAQAQADGDRTRAELAALGARVTVVPAPEAATTLDTALDAELAAWWAAEGPDGQPSLALSA